jgi:hypothetical protein
LRRLPSRLAPGEPAAYYRYVRHGMSFSKPGPVRRGLGV